VRIHPKASLTVERGYLLDSFRRPTERDTILDDEISSARAALAECSSDHSDYVNRCRVLSRLLHRRSETTGSNVSLEECIRLDEEVLIQCSEGDHDRARACSDLASSLRMRFRRTGMVSSLHSAIELNREALELRPWGHPDRAASCIELSTSLRRLFDLDEDESLVTEAETLDRQALTLHPVGHPDRDATCSSLAASLTLQIEHTGHGALLEQIIELQREVLALRPAGHPLRAVACEDLANSLMTQVQQDGDQTLLTEVATLFKEALKLYLVDDPMRWRLMLSLARLHMNPRWPQYDIIRSINFLRQAIFADQDDLPSLLDTVAAILGDYDLTRTSMVVHRRLLEAYAAAIDLSVVVTGFVLDQYSQLRYLRACRAFASGSYVLASLVGKHTYGLELLERGRGVLWSRALHIRDPQLQDVPPELASELGNLLHNMEGNQRSQSTQESTHLTMVPSMKLSNRYEQNARILQLIQEIRTISGFEDFMRNPSSGAPVDVASFHPVVVLVAARNACHALVIQNEKEPPIPLLLLAIKMSDLQRIAFGSKVARWRGKTGDGEDATSEREMVGRRLGRGSSRSDLQQLWTAVVKPVIVELGLQVRIHLSDHCYIDGVLVQKKTAGARPRVHWCPTGAFTFIPLHAAGIYDGPISTQECCADYMVSSYTPTLAALSRAQEKAKTFSAEHSKLLLVAAQHSNLPYLPNISLEMTAVAAIANSAHISVDESCASGSATTASVTECLTGANLIHIACHGIQDPRDALASGFGLADGRLTVSQLMKIKHNDLFFAFLSACETAKGDQDQPDQTVHLAAAMLFAGFKSIVATMWCVHPANDCM
jgi:hypothetical protein